MKTSKIILGILAGAGVGALLGMLYAPEKGNKLRRKISNKKEDITDSIKEKFEEFVDTYTRKYEKAMANAKNSIAEGKSKLNEMTKEFEAEISK